MRTSILLPAAVLAVLGAFAQPCYQQAYELAGAAPVQSLVAEVATSMTESTSLRVAPADTLSTGCCAGSMQFSFAAAQSPAMTSFPVATGALVFVVHPHRTLTNLTSLQVAALCSGQIQNWRELDGPDAPVHLVLASEFARDQLAAAGVHAEDLGALDTAGNDRRCARTVTSDPFRIGCMSATAAMQAIEAGAPLRILSLDGVTATNETILNHQYPLSQPLFLTVPTALQDVGNQVLDYLGSDLGSAVLASHGFLAAPRS